MPLATFAPRFIGVEASHPTSLSSPSTRGTSITAGAANTKGAYAEIIAALTYDVAMLVVEIHNSYTVTTNTAGLLDIAIGTAGNESIILPNLIAGQTDVMNTAAGGGLSGRSYTFPISIAAGERLSARWQSADASNTARVLIRAYGQYGNSEAQWAGSQVVAYGIDTTASKGVTVVGGTSSAFGSWTSIGTTTQDHKALVVGVGAHTSTMTGSNVNVLEVGIDTSSTATIGQNFRWNGTANEHFHQDHFWLPIYNNIPSGTTLAVRTASVAATVNDWNVAIYGVS